MLRHMRGNPLHGQMNETREKIDRLQNTKLNNYITGNICPNCLQAKPQYGELCATCWNDMEILDNEEEYE